jgi:biotin operon repressor
MPYVPQAALTRFELGDMPKDIHNAQIPTMLGDPVSLRQAQAWHLFWRTGIADPGSSEVGKVETSSSEMEAIVKLAKNKFISLRSLSAALDRSESTIQGILTEMQGLGYNIDFDEQQAHLSTKKWIAPVDKVADPIANAMHFKVAVASDWHVGSIYEQHTHLMNFLQYALDKGYRHFAIPGDLTEGLKMRVGHELGMYVHSVDAIVQLLHRPLRLLQEAGAQVYVIGGNHDFTIVRNCLSDPIWTACQAYDDVHFLGYDKADVPITDKVSFRMWHPDGAGQNPVGKLQKSFQVIAHEEMISQLGSQDTESSNVAMTFVGHLHIYSMLQHGRRAAMQVSCFQGMTDFLERHALIPSVGGHLVDLMLSDSGDVLSWAVENRLYAPIANDYKNYCIPSVYTVDTVNTLVRIQAPVIEKV